MSFVPYLHFSGCCAEAMAWYAQVFDGELVLFRYREAPGMPPEFAQSDLVMHAALTTPGAVLMASDYPPGATPEPQRAVSISHFEPSEAGARAVFERLAEGGEVVMPFADTFWAEGFGMARDRFGTQWMVSGPQKQPAGQAQA